MGVSIAMDMCLSAAGKGADGEPNPSTGVSSDSAMGKAIEKNAGAAIKLARGNCCTQDWDARRLSLACFRSASRFAQCFSFLLCRDDCLTSPRRHGKGKRHVATDGMKWNPAKEDIAKLSNEPKFCLMSDVRTRKP